MIELRPLLYQIQQRKPDVLDLAGMVALQSAAREVLQRTNCWRIDVDGTLTAGAASTAITAPNQTVNSETQTVEVLQIIRLEIVKDTTVASLPALPNALYPAGKVVYDLTTHASYCSSGTAWVARDTVWYPMRERSAQVMDAMPYHPSQTGMPTKYMERHGTAFFDLLPDYAYAFKARVSMSPLDHFESVELMHTPEAELMLVEGAMAQLWEYGEKANPKMADRAREKFLMKLQNYGADVLATNGQAILPPSALTPRRWR